MYSHSLVKDIGWDNLQYNIIHYIITLTNNSLSKTKYNPTNQHHSALLLHLECEFASTIGNVRLTYFKKHIQF